MKKRQKENKVNLPAASRGASAAQLETNLRRLMPREALA